MTVERKQQVVITPSYDSGWSGSVSNLTDGNTGTEVQVNNDNQPRHWVQLDFNIPVALSNLNVTARAGGAGCGAIAWITSTGQVVTSTAKTPSTNFNVSFNSSLITWVRAVFTTSATSFDGFGEITPTYTTPTVGGIKRRIRGAYSIRSGGYGIGSILPKGVVGMTVTADSVWYSNSLANIVDGNTGTDIQANNQSITNHWVQVDFSPSIYLAVAVIQARGGSAGCGASTWTTSDSQSQNVGSLGDSVIAVATFTGAAVSWVRCTWTGSRTNFDGLKDIWFNAAPVLGTTYLGGYVR